METIPKMKNCYKCDYEHPAIFDRFLNKWFCSFPINCEKRQLKNQVEALSAEKEILKQRVEELENIMQEIQRVCDNWEVYLDPAHKRKLQVIHEYTIEALNAL